MKRPSSVIELPILATSLFVAVLSSSLDDWFGIGDIKPMFAWTLPLVFALTPILKHVSSRMTRASPMTRLTALIFSGIAGGFIWTVLVFLALGPMIGAFSFPVLYCWVFGGICGGLTANRTLP